MFESDVIKLILFFNICLPLATIFPTEFKEAITPNGNFAIFFLESFCVISLVTCERTCNKSSILRTTVCHLNRSCHVLTRIVALDCSNGRYLILKLLTTNYPYVKITDL